MILRQITVCIDNREMVNTLPVVLFSVSGLDFLEDGRYFFFRSQPMLKAPSATKPRNEAVYNHGVETLSELLCPAPAFAITSPSF